MPKGGPNVVWTPQPGSQTAFLQCPVYEVLYHGTRGGCGKTDSMIMDFVQHVGQGWGPDWRGVLFRRTFPELSDVIAKTQKWFNELFGRSVSYNKADHTWTWGTGEQLLLRHMKIESDYYSFHGHAYPWIGWEEMTTWPNDKCFRLMMSCSRSTRLGMPRKLRGTTNPYGIGHNWVKTRYRLPEGTGQLIKEESEPPRLAIKGHIKENQLLLAADPYYVDRLRAAARNPSELAAWMEGDWNITSGGMFDDLWQPQYHVIPPISFKQIPKSWRLDRAFDWGSSRPFAVGWWAESSGESINLDGRKVGAVRGDLILLQEWYGWSGTRNEGSRMLAGEIASGIRDRETDWGMWRKIKAGPADTSIWDEENGVSIIRDFTRKGVTWERADKGPGSRKQGWEMVRRRLFNARPNPDGTPREHPGLYVTRECVQWLETVPPLARSDKDPDDVDTDAEDHMGDMTRYRVRLNSLKAVRQRTMF